MPKPATQPLASPEAWKQMLGSGDRAWVYTANIRHHRLLDAVQAIDQAPPCVRGLALLVDMRLAERLRARPGLSPTGPVARLRAGLAGLRTAPDVDVLAALRLLVGPMGRPWDRIGDLLADPRFVPCAALAMAEHLEAARTEPNMGTSLIWRPRRFVNDLRTRLCAGLPVVAWERSVPGAPGATLAQAHAAWATTLALAWASLDFPRDATGAPIGLDVDADDVAVQRWLEHTAWSTPPAAAMQHLDRRAIIQAASELAAVPPIYGFSRTAVCAHVLDAFTAHVHQARLASPSASSAPRRRA